MNKQRRKEIKDCFILKIKELIFKFVELPIFEKYQNQYYLNPKINSKNYFWFSISSLIIYPLILAALLWPTGEQKSIIQILKNQMDLWMKNSNEGLIHYLQLVGIIYGSCFLIYSIVSILWIEVVIASGTDLSKFKKLIKGIGSVILFGILIITWGNLKVIKKILDYFINIKIPYLSYQFRVAVLFGILAVAFEVMTCLIIWLITDINLKRKVLIHRLIIFIVISFISIVIACQKNLFWLSFLTTLFYFYYAIKDDFNRILLTNSFILFIGNLISHVIQNTISNITIINLLNLFVSMIVTIYICEWIVLKIRVIKNLTENEKDSIEDIIKNLFGSLVGSSIILVFVLLERFL